MVYAVLASVLHITERILDPDQEYLLNIPFRKEQIQSIHQSATFLIDFLEDCSPNPNPTLNTFVTKIRDAAYRVEDILETHLSNHFLRLYFDTDDSLEILSQLLEKVLEEINSLEDEVKNTNIEEAGGIPGDLHRSNSLDPGLLRRGKSKMVIGVGDDLLELKDRLTDRQSNLQVIPIIGMGGIGKTTIARNLYDDKLITEHSDISGWVTISQEYSVPEILSTLLSSIGAASCGDLKECLYKGLKGRRYLIILDDMWDTKVWDELRGIFPNDNEGSRIIITTRLLDVGVYATDTTSPPHQMHFLDDDKSWDLLRQEVFGEEACPCTLEEIGKNIAKNCQGLPLAVAVIGGLLSKSEKTTKYWEYVARNIHSVVVENDEKCMEILALSYKHLPHCLKACFIYLAVFPEDYEISATKLIRLWIAEELSDQLDPKASKRLQSYT